MPRSPNVHSEPSQPDPLGTALANFANVVDAVVSRTADALQPILPLAAPHAAVSLGIESVALYLDAWLFPCISYISDCPICRCATA